MSKEEAQKDEMMEDEPDTPRKDEKVVPKEEAAAEMKKRMLELLPKYQDKKKPINPEEYWTEKYIAPAFWLPRKEEYGGKPWLDEALYLFARSRAFDYDSATKRFFKFNAAAHEVNVQSFDEMSDDIAQTLKDSACYHMPDQPDGLGRPVVYMCCSFFKWEDMTVMAAKRMHMWLFWQWAIMWGEVAQTKGVSFIMCMKNMTMAQYKKEFEDWLDPIFMGNLPIKIAAMYMCYDPFWFGNMMWPVMKFMMSKKMRERVIWLGGKDEKVLPRYLESAFGIPRGEPDAQNLKASIPSDMCGTYVLDKDSSERYFTSKYKMSGEKAPEDCLKPEPKKKK